MNTPEILPSRFNLELLKLHQKVFLPIYYFALLCVCEIKSNFYFIFSRLGLWVLVQQKLQLL